MAVSAEKRSGQGARRVRVIAVVLAVLTVVPVGTALLAARGAPEAPAWVSARPIAHRGDWTPGPERPENSLAAFVSAVDRSLAIELDVHLSSDGAVVVLHDPDLHRMTGQPGAVSDTPLAEIRQRRLLGGTEAVPTLAEVLALVNGRVPVFVDIKNPSNVGPLEDAVARELSAYPHEAAVMSFNPFSLGRVASTAPGVVRGQLSGDFVGKDRAWYEVFLLRNLLLNWVSKPHFVAMQLDLVPSATTAVQAWWGTPLLCWTARTRDDVARAASSCDAVIGDPGSR